MLRPVSHSCFPKNKERDSNDEEISLQMAMALRQPCGSRRHTCAHWDNDTINLFFSLRSMTSRSKAGWGSLTFHDGENALHLGCYIYNKYYIYNYIYTTCVSSLSLLSLMRTPVVGLRARKIHLDLIQENLISDPFLTSRLQGPCFHASSCAQLQGVTTWTYLWEGHHSTPFSYFSYLLLAEATMHLSGSQ